MNIFPIVELSRTEEDIVKAHLSDPTVVKYLHLLAMKTGSNIVLAAPKPGESAEEHLRAVAGAQGQLAAINTLLEISKPAEQQPSE